MEENRGGFWQSHFGWAIELGYRLMTNIFGDNFPVAAGPPLEQPTRASTPAAVVLGRRPHIRRCHHNHDRPSDPEPVFHIIPPTDRALSTAMALALRRYIQFGGLVQYVAEITGVPREAVVHLDVEGRIGVINNRIRAEHRVLFKELQRCLDNVRSAFANETDSSVMEDFDRVQTDRLQLLQAVDFGGNVVPQVRENLKRIQIDGLDILAEYYASANEAHQREYDDILAEMSSFTFHELFLYGQQGYRKCYYELERADQDG